MKKLFFILAILILAGILYFASTSTETKVSSDANIPASTPVSSQASNTIAPTTIDSAPNSLPIKAQNETARCLGKPVKDMKEFYQAGLDKLGAIKGESLNWKSIFFEDGEKRFQLSLAHEVLPSGKEFMELKVFSLDHEDLPDLVRIPEDHRKNPSPELIQQYLSNKRITKIQESKDIEFEEGIIQIETENDEPKEIKLETPNMRLACGTNFDASCKCSL